MDNSLSYLLTPPESSVPPPINKTIDDLPIEKIAWEDFERLCLRIVELTYSIHDCEIFGRKGQAQFGIDIFAKKTSGQYGCYQCKRYQEIEERDLEIAITDFLNGAWSRKSDEFFFCTTAAMNDTGLQTKFEELKKQLSVSGITLRKYDKDQIIRMLKKEPQIVYDFFGGEWVKRFNGEESLGLILKKRSLDSLQVARYRAELRQLYSIVFNTYDLGIPIEQVKQHSSIEERFVVPDGNLINSRVSIQDPDLYEVDKVSLHEYNKVLNNLLPGSESEKVLLDELNAKKKSDRGQRGIHAVHQRIPITELIVQNNNTVILGDPGSGKSTLLRNLVLDVLSSRPRFEGLAKAWGRHLPVWIPFAFITKALSHSSITSLHEILKSWLRSHDKEHLYELLELALNDERLVLLVDGIDELTDLSAARQAVSRIQIHSGIRNTRVIYSSRPYGFRMLQDQLPMCTQISVLPFSFDQQRRLVTYWYEKWMEGLGKSDPHFAAQQTTNFLEDISRSHELETLAENPLLLSILITQKLKNSVLPTNKLKALESITEHLVDIHPKKRTVSAGIVQEERFDFDLHDVFRRLAFQIQMRNSDGVIDKADAQKIIENFLTQDMGYQKPRAKKTADDILNIGANEFGLIVEKSPSEISFSHRLFQEFLAARYLIESEDEYQEVLSRFGGHATWHQVIKFYFGLIPSGKPKLFAASLKLIGQLNNSMAVKYQILFLKYDIAISFSNAPIELSRENFHTLCNEFDHESSFSVRSVYWDIIVGAIRNPKIASEAQKYLFRYFPSHYEYNDYRLREIQKYQSHQVRRSLAEFLLKSLISGNYYQRFDASQAIKKFIQDPWLLDQVTTLLKESDNPEVIGFALNCITTDAIGESEKTKWLAYMNDSIHPDVLLFVFKLKVHLKKQTAADLNQFADIVDRVDYQIRDEAAQVLVDGWAGDPGLLAMCIRSIERGHKEQPTLDHSIAWKVLFKAFNKEESVVNLIINKLKEEHVSFGIGASDGWEYIAHYYKGNPALIQPVKLWLLKRKFLDRDAAFAAFLSPAPEVKKIFMDVLNGSGIPHWAGMVLVEVFKEDAEASTFMRSYFRSYQKGVSYCAHLVPTVFSGDPQEGINILEKIAFDRDAPFRNRAIEAIIHMDKEYFQKNILEKFVADELPLLPRDDIWGEYTTIIFILVNNFPQVKMIKDFALENLVHKAEYFHLIIAKYREEVDIVDRILEQSQPMHDDLRLKMIEALSTPNASSDVILKLSEFESESDGIVSSSAAIAYFKLHQNSPDQIISVAKQSVFYRGVNYEIHRLISFCGYLLAHRLQDYADLLENGKSAITDLDRLFEIARRKLDRSMVKVVVDNFDYYMQFLEANADKLSEKGEHKKEIFWAFWADHTTVSSPPFPYLMKFIQEKQEEIYDLRILDFMSRTQPQSLLLKSIAMRLINDDRKDHFGAARILAKNFRQDKGVLSELLNFKHFMEDQPKIVALCIGWEDQPILKSVFTELISENFKPRYRISREMGYQLKFLFRDSENIFNFIQYVITNHLEAYKEYEYFIVPLIKRIRKDVSLQTIIREMLFQANSLSEKISYYQLLASANLLDEEILTWKDKQIPFEKKLGYDILSNRPIPFSSILYELTY